MRRFSFLCLLLFASAALWAEANLLLCFEPLQKTFKASVETAGLSLDLSYRFTSEMPAPSVALGPFRIKTTRITVRNTTLHPLFANELFETRLEHPQWGRLSLFRADGRHIGLGFEWGAFTGIFIRLPILEPKNVFLPHRKHQGLTVFLRYSRGPVTVHCIGSAHTPLSLQGSVVLHAGAFTMRSVLDSSAFPYRLTLGLEGGKASLSHEFSVGREPIYSGSEQVLRVSQKSNVATSIGFFVIGLDYLHTLQTEEDRMVRTDLRIRATIKHASNRIRLVWREREGWSFELKGGNGSLVLSKEGVAYEFVAHLEQGEVRISLTSKGVFSIAYTGRFTIGQRR